MPLFTSTSSIVLCSSISHCVLSFTFTYHLYFKAMVLWPCSAGLSDRSVKAPLVAIIDQREVAKGECREGGKEGLSERWCRRGPSVSLSVKFTLHCIPWKASPLSQNRWSVKSTLRTRERGCDERREVQTSIGVERNCTVRCLVTLKWSWHWHPLFSQQPTLCCSKLIFSSFIVTQHYSVLWKASLA